MPSVKKKPVSKSVVSNLKSKPKWKFGILAVVLVFVLTTVGYVGYNQYRERTLKAHAANWTFMGSARIDQPEWLTVSSYGCKTTVNSIYGPLYKVQVMYAFSNSSLTKEGSTAALLQAFRNGKQLGSTGWSGAWWAGTTTVVTTTVSAALHDTITGTVQRIFLFVNPFTNYDPAKLTNC